MGVFNTVAIMEMLQHVVGRANVRGVRIWEGQTSKGGKGKVSDTSITP